MRFTLPASIALILTAAAVSINAGQSATSQSSVTFTKDIAPIFQENCQACHRPGSIAPMSLLTYSDARPWARSIKLKVAAREMPPWFIDKNVGVQHFSNDRSLSSRDIDTIVKWVDAGAPEGNPADMPPPRQFPAAEVWQIGQPDVIVSLPKDYIVPAKAPDRWPDILVDPHLTEDRYIKAVQIIPSKGFTVIHHIRTSIVEPTDATLGSGKLDDADVPLEVGEQGVFLNEYAIGKQGDVFPDGSGRLIRRGTKINFQMHLHATGKEDTPTNVMLGLKFYPKGYAPNHAINSTTVSAREVDIRPHTDNVRSDGYLTLKKAARLLSFQPHMHNRERRSVSKRFTRQDGSRRSRVPASVSTGTSITSTPTMPLRCCRRERCCIRSCGTTTPPAIRSTRIRMRRLPTGSGRSTRWRQPGSAGTSCPTRT